METKATLRCCGLANGHYQALTAVRGERTVHVLTAFWPGDATVREIDAPGPIDTLGLGPSVVANRVLYSYSIDTAKWVRIGSLDQAPVPAPTPPRKFEIRRAPVPTDKAPLPGLERVMVRALHTFDVGGRQYRNGMTFDTVRAQGELWQRLGHVEVLEQEVTK